MQDFGLRGSAARPASGARTWQVACDEQGVLLNRADLMLLLLAAAAHLVGADSFVDLIGVFCGLRILLLEGRFPTEERTNALP